MQNQKNRSVVHLATLPFLLVIVVVFNSFAQNVITWVPPYSWQSCKTMLNTDFGGVKMEDGITHLALQFWGPVPTNGSIKYVTHEWQTPNDATVAEFTSWASGKNVKVLLCLYNNDGTWNWNLVKPIIDDPSKRTNLVNTLVSEVQRLGLDGVEVDLEYPGGTNSDKPNFMAFMTELSNSLRAIGKELTIATFAYIWNFPNSDCWNELAAITDGITSMGYEEIGRNASGWASYSTQKTLVNDPSKLMLGIPTYVGSWQGSTAEQQVDWVVADGEVGIGIWDCSLADGNGTPMPGWRTASIWNKLKQIKGSVPQVTQYTVNASAGSGGTISPSGNVSVDSSANQSFSISANSGYEIDYVTVDGNNQGAISGYTFNNVTANHTINAYFKVLPVIPTYNIVSNAIGNGSISPNGTTILDSASSQSYSIAADADNQIDSVIVDGNNIGVATSYSFNSIKSNHTITAYFSRGTCDAPEWNSSLSYNNGDVVSYIGHEWLSTKKKNGGTPGSSGFWTDLGTCSNGPSFTITSSAGSNGSINPSGNVTVSSGGNQSYSVNANSGYEIDYVTVDGNNQGAISTYTFNNITANHTIDAYFKALPQYDITANAGANGSISPSGTVSVTEGENETFNITANSGYEIDYVTVDGNNQGAISSYTFTNVVTTHTINAYFKLIPIVTHDITASAGSNGSISPSGTITINNGENQIFNIYANSGYEINDVIVDGNSQGAISTYTFTNVTSVHSISATFKVTEVVTINKPFPMELTYPGVIKPTNVTQASMNGSIQSVYNSYKSSYLTESNVSGDYYIKSDGTGSSGTLITVSEAHGYGMMVFALMAGYDDSAKIYFDGMYDFYKRFPSSQNSNFMSWEVFQGETGGSNSASDGDMDIAYALLLAHDQWGSNGTINYISEANRIISAIQSDIISSSTYRIKLGDWAVDAWNANNKYNTRSSDWMAGHVKAYKKATSNGVWDNVHTEIYQLISEVRSGYASSTGLMPDFVTADPAQPDATGGGTGESNAEKYYWNACRYPWRIAMDYMHYGTSASRSEMMTFVDWAKSSTGGNAGNFYPGYNLNGTPITTSYNDIAFVAPLVVASIVDGSYQTFLNNGWSTVASWGYADDVYGKAIQLMSMLAISGNWWAPGEPLPNTGNYTINASASTGGSISPSGSVSVSQGLNQSFTISASGGYEIDSVLVDGSYVGAVSSYTFTSVTANHTIDAIFKSTSLPQYTVTVTSGANGAISPSGSVSITEGNDQTFTIIPNSGYEVDSVFVDGSFVGSVTSYTLSNVTGNHSVSATFKALPVVHTITASAGSNGSINPTGNVSVSDGGNQAFTITANTGYTVDSVIVDGVNIGSVTSYTFNNVTANHSISAYFKSSGTGGNCDGVPAWDANGWTTGNYVMGYKVTNANHLWEVINDAQTHWEPSGSAGHFGWADLGECVAGGPDTTVQTSQVSNTITFDTTINKDSIVTPETDTIVETTETIIRTDETIIKTDSLSDAIVFATVYDTVTVFDTTINVSLDTLWHTPDTTLDTNTWNVVVKDTVVDIVTDVNVDKDTVTTTTTTENVSDTLFTQTDSLSDGVVYSSDTVTSVTNSSNVLSVVSDTSYYQADTTTQTNTWNVVVKDTVVDIVTDVNVDKDTITTTTTTENVSDTLFTQTDSLSDGVVYASDTVTSVTNSTNVLSVVSDTSYYQADTTTQTNSWNLVVKDTVADVVIEVNVNKDTITTTTTTENVSDTLFTQTDSLSDGVVYASDTVTSVTNSTNVLSVVSDTSYYQADTTTNTANWNVVVKDTVVDVQVNVNFDLDTITTTTTTENVSDTLFTQTDSLSDGVVYASDTVTSVTNSSNVLSIVVDTNYYQADTTTQTSTWNVIVKDTVVDVATKVVGKTKDTIVTTTTTENVLDSLFTSVDSLSDGINYASDTSVSVSTSSNEISVVIDTLYYQADTTTQTNTWNVVVKDTVVDIVTDVNVDKDTITTTTTTENVSDTLFTQTDSLSDGVVYASDTVTSVTNSTNVLSVVSDTSYYQADTTTQTNTWNVVVKDTVVDIVTDVNVDKDTITTTTTTENVSDTLFTQTDSLSDGVVYASDTVTSVTNNSNVLSVISDTSYYHADTTTQTNSWNLVVKDTVADVVIEVNVNKDTITTTTTTENVSDTLFTQTDSLSDGVVYASDTVTSVTNSTNVLSVVSDTSYYQADTTTQTNTWNVVVKDTVADVVTEVNVDKDTITTTTTTENVSDTLFTQTDSLSDGVVYASDTVTSVTNSTNVLSVVSDTSYYQADTTTQTFTWNVVAKDTMVDVLTEINVNHDTIITTTTTENVVDSSYTSIDSLSDGVVYASDTSVFITSSSNILSIVIDTLKFNNTVQYVKVLKSGWSYISFNVISLDMNVEAIFADITMLETVKDDEGNTYMPGVINTIGNIDITNGYKIYTPVVDTVTYNGTPVDVSNTPIQLNKGWNVISFLPANAMAVEVALQSIITEVDAVKDDDGGSFMPGKINTLGNMIPGKGYKINMKNSATLIYPEN